MDLQVARETSASPDEVWAVMTDVEGSVERLSAVTAVERLDDGEGFGPGTRWRETREMLGRQVSEELEVTAVDEGRSYTVEADSRGTHYTSVCAVEPHGTGSRLTMTFVAAQSGGRFGELLARTVGKAFEGASRKALQQDLDDIAAAAEAASTGA